MSDANGFQRWCDVVVIGGSAAGLAGALMLARSRRSVIVVDGGEPRNAPAAHMHGYLGYEGKPPGDLLATGREEVRSYGVEILEGRVDAVEWDGDRFVARLADGAVSARKVLVATGATDELPAIDGLAEHWGDQVIHCPYCHGWEVRGERVVLVATNPMAAHQAGLFRQLTDDVTVVVHDPEAVGEQGLAALVELAPRGVEVITEPAVRVVTSGDRLAGLELRSGRVVGADAVAVATFIRARADMIAPLGIEPTLHPMGIGTAIEVGEMGATSVRGVYAAGNVANPMLQVLPSAAAGSMAGAVINAELVHDDASGLGSPNEWDLRYGSDDQIWSGNPNGTLVAEVDGMDPGRALDVGCGEGADSVWLAEQGWQVVALDVASSALERTSAAAATRGVSIETVCADVPSARFEPGSFELVSVFYPAIPRTPEGEALDALLDAVAPGGTLLVVGHSFDDRDDHDGHGHTPAFDPRAYVQVDDIAARLDPAGWTVLEHGVRDRPAGHDTPHHRDLVLRTTKREESGRVSQGSADVGAR